MRHNKPLYKLIAVVLMVGLSVFGLWYYATQQDSYQSTQSEPISNTKPDSKEMQDGEPSNPITYPTSVYFSKHPESDDDPGKTFPLSRTSPDFGVAKFTISELLKGPTVKETEQGYFATTRLREASSTCDGADFTLTIEDSTATLHFCKPFDHLGVVADGQADSEIKATLMQFESVKKVVILNSQWNCEFDLSGENLCLQ